MEITADGVFPVHVKRINFPLINLPKKIKERIQFVQIKTRNILFIQNSNANMNPAPKCWCFQNSTPFLLFLHTFLQKKSYSIDSSKILRRKVCGLFSLNFLSISQNQSSCSYCPCYFSFFSFLSPTRVCEKKLCFYILVPGHGNNNASF